MIAETRAHGCLFVFLTGMMYPNRTGAKGLPDVVDIPQRNRDVDSIAEDPQAVPFAPGGGDEFAVADE
jgi:hypothetical protein